MAITFSISGGADAAKFTINPTTGVLAFVTAPDFEVPTDANIDNVYQVTVKATDSAGLFDTKTIAVTVTNVAEGGALPPLTASGSITASANNQIIENKLVTGKILIEGKSGVTVRNCWVKHPGGIGIETLSCTNLTIEDVYVENTSAPTGMVVNPAEAKNVQLQLGGPFFINRLTVRGGRGIYCYQTSGRINISFLEGHNSRGSTGRLDGQLVALNQCSGGMTLTDFSNENDPTNSWSEDNISLHQNNTSTNNIIIRRGLLDGNNSKTGVGIMCEVGTNGVLTEDVDCVRQGNGTFGAYSATSNTTFRRCRARDTIQADQGRGVPTSGYLTFASSSDCTNTRFEACEYWNVRLDNLAWDLTTMTAQQFTQNNFTLRSPIRNRTPGT